MDNNNLEPSFENTLPVLRVYRWRKSNKHLIYIFVGDKAYLSADILQHIERAEKSNTYWNDVLINAGYGNRPPHPVKFIFATVWQDDRITYALTKILRYIQTTEDKKGKDFIPFAWNSDGLLRFEWNTLDIDPSTIDPWKKRFPIVNKQPYYIPYQLIGSDDINIILYDDMSDFSEKERHMYFPDAEETQQLPLLTTIQKTEEYLTTIWTTQSPTIRDRATKIRSVMYEASFDPSNLKISLSDVFEKVEATNKTQLIQWSDDITRVMYKLYKKHAIPANTLNKWIDRYNIPEIPSLIIYTIWSKSNTYSKIHIQEDGMIQVTYFIDTSDNKLNTMEDITKHAMETMDNLSELLEIPIDDTELVDISYDFTLSISMLGLKNEQTMFAINNELGNAIPLFFSVSMGQETRKKIFVFKRASNLEYDFSLSETAQSLLEYGVDMTDITELFKRFGYTKEEINNTWGELKFAAQNGNVIKPKFRFDKDDIPMLQFLQQDGSFMMSLKHFSNIEEAKLTLKWFVSILFNTIQSLYKEDIIRIKSSTATATPSSSLTIAPESEQEKEQEQPAKSIQSIKRRKSSENLEFEFAGGARIMKKTGDGFLLDKLQNADKLIFENKEVNYARGCQQKFQPLVMTKEEWEASKTKISNSILYRNNYYSCPRIWCKEAKIAMKPTELEKNKGKCPKTDEEPVILWKEEKERFVGFNTNIIKENGKKIYSPCCFKKDQFKKGEVNQDLYDDLVVYNERGEEVKIKKKKAKGSKEEAEEEAEEKEQEEETMQIETKVTKTKAKAEKKTYIFTRREPVPEKDGERYGSVPSSLYRIFYPNYAEQGNNITTQPTIVRHGIGKHDDSLMESIAYVLDLEPEKKNKEGLVEAFVDVLDPLTFISLEGGSVLAAFMSDGIPTISYEAWKEWIDKDNIEYKKYKKYMKLDDPSLKPDSDIILREIKIYEAYLKFIHHLQSDDEKNTRILYHLLALYGILLIIWERDKTDDDIRLSCPYFMDYHTLRQLIPNFKNRYIMLLHDEYYKPPYYEPLEIRTLNAPPITQILLEEYPKVNDIMTKCPVSYSHTDFAVMEKIRGMIYWVNSVFEFNAKQFMPKYVILASDLRIEGLITTNHLWIQLPRPSLEILIRCMEMFSSMKLNVFIQYHEDIDYASFVSRVNEAQFEFFRQKCDVFGFKVSDSVPPPAPVVPIVSIMSYTYQQQFENIDKQLKGLRDVQLKIARYLLYHYHEKVEKHVKKPRKEFIDIMLTLVIDELWKKYNDNGSVSIPVKLRSQMKTAIEEMPLIYGRDSLQKWIHIITLEPYHFYDSNLYTDNKAWSFSQLAVEVGLPKDVLIPSAAVKPKQNSIPEQDDLRPIQVNEQIEAPILTEVPLMALESEIQIEEMPVKWRKFIKLMKVKKYEPKYIMNLFTWLAHQNHSPLTWRDVSDIKYLQIANIFEKLSKQEFKKALEPLLQEATFKKIWIKKLKQSKHVKADALLEVMWNERLQLDNILKEIADTDPSPLWPMYIDLQIMAQLLDIFILVILIRKPYGTANVEKVADIEKFRLSSELYCNLYTTMERPLVILYKEIKDDTSIYHLTLSGENKYYYSSASDTSILIQNIIKAHIEKRE